ncbi:unnamed protein product [Durusdinium trenchii]|uniref:SET domain-containing protein n=1 Tax=Durusdinium trenchii TaxID=1381693 RepID=A0ABP0S820_9DINO
MGLCQCLGPQLRSGGFCDIAWNVSTVTRSGQFQKKAARPATAAQNVVVGQEVDRCICISLRELPGYLQEFCFNTTQPETWLLPLGRALLFGRDHSPNLAVEMRDEGTKVFLVFIAVRNISTGESLSVPAQPSVSYRRSCEFECPFQVISQRLLQTGTLFQALPNDRHFLKDQVTFPSSSKTRLGISGLHEVGCFAECSMVAGEIAEEVPVLPIPWSDVCENALRDYVFASEFETLAGVCPFVLLPLGHEFSGHWGLGALYNHSDEPNVYPHRYANVPFLQAWVCQRDVQAGEELPCSELSRTRHQEYIASGCRTA